MSCLLGFAEEDVLKNISLLVPVSGRFETLLSENGIMAVVDYAHTPDALENVLSTIKGLVKKGNKVITVVGVGWGSRQDEASGDGGGNLSV